jgi:hypothetical protein
MVKWKRFERKRSWPDFKVLSQFSHGGTVKNHEKSQDIRSPDRDLNLRPPEYEAGEYEPKIIIVWLNKLITDLSARNYNDLFITS